MILCQFIALIQNNSSWTPNFDYVWFYVDLRFSTLMFIHFSKDIFLYCSEVTQVLLVASKKYRHLKPFIVSKLDSIFKLFCFHQSPTLKGKILVYAVLLYIIETFFIFVCFKTYLSWLVFRTLEMDELVKDKQWLIV